MGKSEEGLVGGRGVISEYPLPGTIAFLEISGDGVGRLMSEVVRWEGR